MPRHATVVAAFAATVAAVVLGAGTAAADTIVSGGNIINQTWTAAGSPYLVQGDIIVPAGAFLTLEAGVEVRASSSSDSQAAGENPARVELRVEGTLTSNGTSLNPVTLRSSSTTVGSWYGVIAGPAANVTLTHTTIRHPIYGLDSRTTGTLTTDHLTVESASARGLWLRAGTHDLATVTLIATGTYGVYVDESASPTLTRCVVRNSGIGVYVRHTSAGRTVGLTNCTLTANSTAAVYSNAPAGNAATITVTSSILTNSQYGLYRQDAATYVLTHSNVWGNSTNYQSVAPGAAMISANPLFVSATDLRLTSNSPSRFGASGGGDQGALPYDVVPTPGLHGVLWTNTTLTAAQSPYTAAGDLTVAPGVTLTLEPGTAIRFASSSDLMGAGENASRGELTVHGRLIAVGTLAAPITLSSTSTTVGSWYGLDLEATATSSVLEQLVIRSPIYGVVYRSTAAGNAISQVTVESASARGFWLRTGTPTLNAITAASTGTYGVYVDETASPTLTNCVIRNSGIGVYVRHTSAGRTVGVVNCTLNANSTAAVYSNAPAGNAATITVTNSNLTGSQYGLYRQDVATFVVTYSNVWGNSTNFQSVTPGAGVISANPQYVSATNLRLQSTSVSIDAGTTGPTRDADGVFRPLDGNGLGGAQWDIGAYEFVLAAECGNGALEPGEACDSGASNGTYGNCNATCTAMGPRCGDALVNGPEACDDGNASNTDACLATCTPAACGDGHVRTGVETCDDGNVIDTDACTAACAVAVCGDGVVHTGVEACDDANTSNTDACVGACQAAACGDGHVQAGVEGCDDGNTADGDACGSTCVSTTCGDGVVQAGVEECDDANTTETDGCRNTCTDAACGDGVVYDGVEECDDGNVAPGDGCSPGCRAELALPDAGPGTDGGVIDEPMGTGCCATSGGDPRGGLVLAACVLLVVRRRRR